MRNTAEYSKFWKNTTQKEKLVPFPEHWNFWINVIQNIQICPDIR